MWGSFRLVTWVFFYLQSLLHLSHLLFLASLIAQLVKNPPAMQETPVLLGNGNPLQYSWTSLVAQLGKNPPAMRETWVGKIPWRRDRLPTPVFCPGEFRGLCSPWGRKESDRLFVHCSLCSPWLEEQNPFSLVLVSVRKVFVCLFF